MIALDSCSEVCICAL